MRLIYVTPSFPYGTAEPFLAPEITELERQGHAVLIVPLRPRGILQLRDVAALLSDTCAVPVVSPRIAMAAWRAVARCRPALSAFRIVMRSRNLRILAKNVATIPKAFWLAELAREVRADHVHAHRASAASTLAMLAAELARVPWSFTAHRWDIFEDNLLREKVRRARFARFIARSGIEEARPFAGNLLDTKAVLVRMGVPLPAGRTRPPAATAERVILCPGSLIRRKGQRHLIDAVASLARGWTNLRLWLAGQGPDEAALRAHVSASHLDDRVQFCGQVAQAQIIEWYRTGRIFAVVLPSLHEGIPVSLMEAMSCGVPVISTRAGGTPELLEGGAGLLVPPADAGALAAGISSLLSDRALRETLAVTGRQKVEREFAIERVVDQLVTLYANGEPRPLIPAHGSRLRADVVRSGRT
jgi:glycosyltransferase involved in cell wall biosynthesis